MCIVEVRYGTLVDIIEPHPLLEIPLIITLSKFCKQVEWIWQQPMSIRLIRDTNKMAYSEKFIRNQEGEKIGGGYFGEIILHEPFTFLYDL